MSVPWGMGVPEGDGSSRGGDVQGGMISCGGGCSRGTGVPGGWVFQGDRCSRG